MKKILILCLSAVLLATTGCGNKEKEEQLKQAQALADATREELATAVTDRDELIALVSEISSGVDEIKQLESILSVPNSGETTVEKENILNDIAAIQKTLQERRERLVQLEKKLNSSKLNNSKLQKTIESLTAQIDAQNAEIESLRTNLDNAQTQIAALDAKVETLNTEVTTVTAQRDSTDAQNARLTDELNTCYYAIGNKSELKENRILETGFLRKSKILEGDFDKAFFTKADKRSLNRLELNSKKVELMTKHPNDSYQLIEEDGAKVLSITNPALFWSLSNYLVIKID